MNYKWYIVLQLTNHDEHLPSVSKDIEISCVAVEMKHDVKRRRIDNEAPIKVNNSKQLIESIHKGKKVVRRCNPKTSQLALLTPPDLSLYAICWIKVRGFKDWPGVIEEYIGGSYRIHFFGDYKTTTVSKNKITNFYEGFSLFQHTFNDSKLKKAIQEACICLMKVPNPTSCLVCSILNCRDF